MAGVKGRSGGARPNTGGKRPGAGRKAAKTAPSKEDDSLVFLRGVMKDGEAPVAQRVRAAIALAQYEHTKLHDGGKKDLKAGAAATAGAGKFAPAGAPKLVVNNR